MSIYATSWSLCQPFCLFHSATFYYKICLSLSVYVCIFLLFCLFAILSITIHIDLTIILSVSVPLGIIFHTFQQWYWNCKLIIFSQRVCFPQFITVLWREPKLLRFSQLLFDISRCNKTYSHQFFFALKGWFVLCVSLQTIYTDRF